MNSEDYEKLGVFYLGREWNPSGGLSETPLLYDSKDLTTHALVVGMTGSGKTGLCLDLLEEAAIDGVPAIAIDPKGDLGNLLLTFPELRPADFEPWVDPAEALRKGQTVAQAAADTADLWSRGLAEWGQSGERIARFRDSVDVAIYTPGASSGLPLCVLRSFDAPPASIRENGEALNDRVQGAVSGLLALLGLEANPILSREHILLANLVSAAWAQGQDLDLPAIIRGVQQPPFDRLGVIDLDTFFPAKDRMQLALRINGLLAAPGFASWLEGEALDIGRLLYTDRGKPRISIISIAHLSDSERMFVVTLVLSELVAWMRTQAGTGSLRALLYMDEIFGFFPPSAQPPSKTPMLTLLKQARAYGLGVVLATQNPVDLDYKGLSNCGTWFIGRLQTERDKERVLEGMERASAAAGRGMERAEMDRTISTLGKRVFLMNNVHEAGPVMFQTRWALSYLKGPLSRTHIEQLMASRRAASPAVLAPAAGSVGAPAAVNAALSAPPLLAGGLEHVFLHTSRSAAQVVYRPRYFAAVKLHFKHARSKTDVWVDRELFAPIDDNGSPLWDEAEFVETGSWQAVPQQLPGARFEQLSSALERPRTIQAAEKSLKTWLYATATQSIFRCAVPAEYSRSSESESEFRQRLSIGLAELRDREMEVARQKYGAQIDRLESKLRATDERIEREKSQLQDRRLQTAVSFGASILGVVLGRKRLGVTTRSSAARTIRDLSRSRREKDDVERAEDTHESLLDQKSVLEGEMAKALEAVRDLPSAQSLALEVEAVRPLKSDLTVLRTALLWQPWGVSATGIAEPLFELRRPN